MKICTTSYNDSNTDLPIFAKWSFNLSDFQKWAIYGLLNNKNVLVTAHTGSGKTVPAEAAILHFTSQSKRVIYTSPIKALTNQKFHEFTKKFPDISFGIITGDNKFNPEAQVLLMTAEILRNTLFRKKMTEQSNKKQSSLLTFEIDIKDELGCVIIDEAHYINDKERGRIWEETIMLLPAHIQLLLLSATLHKPEEQFVPLIEMRAGPEVYVCPTEKRVVPLSHYAYLTIQPSNLEQMSHSNKKEYGSQFNKLLLLKGPETRESFHEKQYDKIRKTIDFLENKKIRINKHFVLNELISMLKQKALLPAIIFVFSRRQVDLLASKVQISLHSNESRMSSTVDKECEKLLRSKLTNWKEYVMLPEYETLINLLRKGVAVHHAGILKEFREMIELLFDKGYIKLLFATETFAVGINMPTRTTVFTSLEKFDGSGFRYLNPSEYTQMAGRAGRRGIDTKGVVIHANNLFSRNEVPTKDYRHILTGPPRSITSKFMIHPNLILQLISSGNTNFAEFISGSMISKDIYNSKIEVQDKLDVLNLKLENKGREYRTSLDILEKLRELKTKMQLMKPKKRKVIQREYDQILDQTKFIKLEFEQYCNHLKLQDKKVQLTHEIRNIDSWVDNTCKEQIELLLNNNFLNSDMSLTMKGKYATYLQEIPSLPVADLLDTDWLQNMTTIDIIAILSCFTNLRLSEEQSVLSIGSINASDEIKNSILQLVNSCNKYTDILNKYQIDTINTTKLHFNLCELAIKWCSCDNETDCKKLIQECKYYDIGLGDFVKAILKINNIAKELENIAIVSENLDLLSKLKCIPSLTLKFCVTNQSLYL